MSFVRLAVFTAISICYAQFGNAQTIILTVEEATVEADGTYRWRPVQCPEAICLPGSSVNAEQWDVDLDGCLGVTSVIFQAETGCIPAPQFQTASSMEFNEEHFRWIRNLFSCDCESTPEVQPQQEQAIVEEVAEEQPEEIDVDEDEDVNAVDENALDEWEIRHTAPVINWILEGAGGVNYSSANGFLMAVGPGIRMEYKQLYLVSRVYIGGTWITRGERFPSEANGNWLGAGFDFDVGIRFAENFSAFLGYHTFTDAGALTRQTLSDGYHAISPGMRSYDATGVVGVDFHFGNYFIEIGGGPGINQFLHREIETSFMLDFRFGMEFTNWITGEEEEGDLDIN